MSSKTEMSDPLTGSVVRNDRMGGREQTYLGDGLYASEDEYGMILLRADREEKESHWVALEPSVLTNFLRYIEEIRGVKIRVEKE